MRQILDLPVSVRLSEATRRRFEQAAAARRMSLSKYLRERLEAEDRLSDQVDQLRLTLLDADAQQSDTDAALGCAPEMLLEMLLLLRQIVTPAQLRATHLELARQGVRPWSADRRADLPE